MGLSSKRPIGAPTIGHTYSIRAFEELHPPERPNLKGLLWEYKLLF